MSKPVQRTGGVERLLELFAQPVEQAEHVVFERVVVVAHECGRGPSAPPACRQHTGAVMKSSILGFELVPGFVGDGLARSWASSRSFAWKLALAFDAEA